MVCDHATQEVVTPVITVHDIDKVKAIKSI